MKKLSILLVDDDSVVRRGMADWFALEDWYVIEAGSGAEALELVRPDIDAVVLDWSMPPGMDGLRTLARMRERFELDRVCIVMLTAYGDVVRAVEALRNGAYQYLQKPFKFDDLKRVLLAGVAYQRAHALRSRILSSLNVDQILEEICRIVLETVHPEALFVALLGLDGSVRHLTQRGLPPEQRAPDTEIPPRDRRFVKQIVKTGSPLFVNAPARLADWDTVMPNTHSLVAAPVPGPNGLVGGVMAMESTTADTFDRNWVDVLRYLADLVGLGVFVADAARVEREMEVYRQLPQTAKELGHWISGPAQSIDFECQFLLDKELSSPDIPAPLREAARSRATIIREKAGLIHRACESLSDITAEIAIDPQAFDLSDLLREVVEEYGHRVSEEGITLSVTSPERSAILLGDRGLLRYCLDCLMDNAIEAIQTRRVRDTAAFRAAVHLKCEVEPATRGVTISVQDTGTGIAPEEVERVFQPLFTTKDNSGARGMGLFSTRRIVVRHGGALSMIPGWQTGATFTIWLPLLHEQPRLSG
jgi:signal transduction histidine kinase/CheY-like chemotaxis protein